MFQKCGALFFSFLNLAFPKYKGHFLDLDVKKTTCKKKGNFEEKHDCQISILAK